MMTRTFKFILLLIMCIVPMCASGAKGQSPQYGLRIQSYPAATTEFTSILLDNGNPIHTDGKEITLEMDLWAYPESPIGSICRILSDNESNIDLMYTLDENFIRYPMLVTGDNDITQSTPIKYAKWVHVSISMSPKTGKVVLDYDGVVSETEYKEFIGTRSVRMAAGLCKLSDYLLFDVASVAVKDVTIYRGDKEIRMWKMERHDGNVCYDEVDHAPATVENANWLVDEAVSWKKLYSAEFPYFPSIAFDPRIATFYLAYKGDKSLLVYHATEGATDTIRTTGGEYMANYPNQLIYINQLDRLLSYNLDENLYSTFNPSSQSWSNDRKSTKEHGYWNNTIVYNPADTSLVSFGGYGYYHYNNILLRSYPYSDKQQSTVTLKDIHPRYSCASALVDSTLYIFGGRGCPSGRQELSPRNYYDMYAVNLTDNSVHKLWGDNTSPLGKDFVVGENMIYDKDENSMYIFATINGGTLIRADLTTGQFEEMSLPINASLEAQTLYCNLYYSAAQQSFYAVMVNSDVQGVSTVNIYQLDFPPVPVASLIQRKAEPKASATALYIAAAVIFCLIIAAVIVIIFMRRRRKPAPVATTPAPSAVECICAPVAEETVEEVPEPATAVKATAQKSPVPAQNYYNLDRSCVRFFGGFRVFDKNGEDITPLFTPTLKQLLILLILYTGENPMGIPNNKLLSLLWSDKEEDAAKNNRNVYMSRLRNLLANIGDVTIQTHNGFRNINFGEGTTCDYLEAQQLFNNNEGENLDRLLELLFNGMMLPNVELDYVDSFKSNFSNHTLDLLSGLIKEPGFSNELKLKIADTLFQHDFINEDALRAKCRILHIQGRTGVAQSVYSTFCKEYKAIVGTDYPYSLTDVINGISDKDSNI